MIDPARCSRADFDAHLALITGGEMGSAARACFEERHEDCSGETSDTRNRCMCLCHRLLDLDI